MIHVQFAAAFCTIALILLAVEVTVGKKANVSVGFVSLYGSGTIVWTVLGWVSRDPALVTVSIVQFFCLVVICLFQQSRGAV